MNINAALDLANPGQNPQETLNVVGTIEGDPQGKIRVYPDPFDLSHYVVIDAQSVDGEVLDVTEHARREDPSRRGHVFSVPVAKGAQIQIVSVKTIAVTDVAKMRFLSLDQSGGCGCSGEGAGHHRDSGCVTGECTTVGGVTYECSERSEDGLNYCSRCCVAVTE
jgi:hypothetical protein